MYSRETQVNNSVVYLKSSKTVDPKISHHTHTHKKIIMWGDGCVK